uniref:CAMK family serine/threonine kinase n=1 Tax=Mimivirus LCMiAC01 TaxID=2506608 RepID=A0A481Z012_9VIRU|nr:MAG: CAMK family serine/threonine kinase [Mimivirus LCMiAC01]
MKILYERVNRIAYIVKSKKDNNKYLVKIKSLNKPNNDEIKIYELLSKIANRANQKPMPDEESLPKANHCIIKFIEHVTCKYFQYFVYEYFDGKTLNEYILDNYNKIGEDDIKKIFMKIVNAVNFLHSNNIIHCDLKLDNILINDKQDIKIIDFDLSKICKDEYLSENIFGTMQYIAPESYDLCIYSKKSDIWSLGIILYIFITKKFPYNSDFPIVNSHDNMYRRNRFKHSDLHKMKEKIKESNYSENVVKLISMMLTFEDNKRIIMDDILTFEW